VRPALEQRADVLDETMYIWRFRDSVRYCDLWSACRAFTDGVTGRLGARGELRQLG
jgi:hypothetical protein